MASFKKCEVPGCNHVLTSKNTRTYIAIDPKWASIGGRAEDRREYIKKKGQTGLEKFLRFNAGKHKFKICSNCMDIIKENDKHKSVNFGAFDTPDIENKAWEDSTTNLWKKPTKVNIIKGNSIPDNLTFINDTVDKP
jgi:hypothetical protein